MGVSQDSWQGGIRVLLLAPPQQGWCWDAPATKNPGLRGKSYLLQAGRGVIPREGSGQRRI